MSDGATMNFTTQAFAKMTAHTTVLLVAMDREAMITEERKQEEGLRMKGD